MCATLNPDAEPSHVVWEFVLAPPTRLETQNKVCRLTTSNHNVQHIVNRHNKPSRLATPTTCQVKHQGSHWRDQGGSPNHTQRLMCATNTTTCCTHMLPLIQAVRTIITL